MKEENEEKRTKKTTRKRQKFQLLPALILTDLDVYPFVETESHEIQRFLNDVGGRRFFGTRRRRVFYIRHRRSLLTKRVFLVHKTIARQTKTPGKEDHGEHSQQLKYGA